MTDTHTHLYLDDFGSFEEQCAVVDRALAAGVSHLVMPNVDLTTVEPMLRLHAAYPEATSVAMGLHPTEVDGSWRAALGKIEEWMHAGRYAAVGEVGMDLYWDKTYGREQQEVFAQQLRWAAEKDLPVIIHQREALPETLEVIRSHRGELPVLVFHSFTGTPEDVEEIRKVCDPWFGINGVSTFKNAGSVREAIGKIGISRILLETDSPYLSPVPHRGKRNESSYICNICSVVAGELGLSPEEAEQATDTNAEKTGLRPIKTTTST